MNTYCTQNRAVFLSNYERLQGNTLSDKVCCFCISSKIEGHNNRVEEGGESTLDGVHWLEVIKGRQMVQYVYGVCQMTVHAKQIRDCFKQGKGAKFGWKMALSFLSLCSESEGFILKDVQNDGDHFCIVIEISSCWFVTIVKAAVK